MFLFSEQYFRANFVACRHLPKQGNRVALGEVMTDQTFSQI